MKTRPYTLVILSAEQLGNPNNDTNTLTLGRMLLSAQFCVCPAEGKYNGHCEKAFVVRLYPPIEEHLVMLKAIAFGTFAQECVLVVHPDDRAALVYSTGSQQDIGTWTDTTDQSLVHKDYTKIGNRVFTIEPRSKTLISTSEKPEAVYAMYGADDGPPSN